LSGKKCNLLHYLELICRMKLDVLAFGAHPDDVEISVGGLLIAEARKGRITGIVDLTRGELGTRGTPELRDEESAAAARIMGLGMRMNLGLPDGMFENNHASRLKVIEVLRRYRPDVVITNAPHDRHPDHGRAAQLVLDACFLSGLRKIQIPDAPEPWRPLIVYQYMQFYQHKPDLIYDITEVQPIKIEAIRAHRSQFYDPNSSEPETLIASKHFLENLSARASEYGIQAGFLYGEPLKLVRPGGIKDIKVLY
jgi:N-acetylglucosamine malate deacetylase 1